MKVDTLTLPLGAQVRVTLSETFDQRGFVPLVRLHGIVEDGADGTGLWINLTTGAYRNLIDEHVCVELMHADGLLRFQALARGDGQAGSSLYLYEIDDPDWIQRRYHLRIPLEGACMMQPSHTHQGSPLHGVTRNISLGGVGVGVAVDASLLPFAKGDHLIIAFPTVARLAGLDWEAEVVHISYETDSLALLGLRFRNLKTRHEEELQELIKDLTQ